MNSARFTARILTGATYAVLGWDAARNPGQRVDIAASTLTAIRKAVPLPDDDEVVVRSNGAVQAAAGTMLAVGIFPRAAASLLAISMVPTTVAGHAFWTVDDPAARKQQRVQLLKNLAMIGGLIFAAIDKPHRSHPVL
ncbi:DoxX family protein [Nocardia asteroides]|uniref:DoxX family protein n=1 Tax=Nocardia asteroides TaxID=1824 RepID=UPI0034370428